MLPSLSPQTVSTKMCRLVLVAAVAFVARAAKLESGNIRGSIAHPGKHGRKAHPHEEEVETPEQVQHELDVMKDRLKHLSDSKAEAHFAGELAHVEDELAVDERLDGRTAEDIELEKEISTVRGDLCVQQGFKHEETNECESFMVKACKFEGGSWDGPAGKKDQAPHVHLNVVAGSAVALASCKQYFFASLRRAAEQVVVTETVEAAVASASGNSSNSSGLFGGKKERDLPEQGFDEFAGGKKVQHNDDDTMTQDWQSEHGVTAGHRDAKSICEDFPDNEWCRIHMFHDSPAVRASPSPPPPHHHHRKERSAAAQGRPALLVLAFLSIASATVVA